MAGKFNAYSDEALSVPGAASGPLSGTRFAVKDLFDIAGHVSCCGNPDWGRTHPPAARHADAVQALLAAGSSVAGKTITDEFAFSIIGENQHYGTPINPNAPGRVCGGSSSGSAAAVAGGLTDFALGTDTGGSVRVPASFCGIFGLRPSHGRVSAQGIFPLAASFDTAGWFARDPQLMQTIASVLLSGYRATPPEPTRLLLPTDAWDQADAETRDALRVALTRLERDYGPAEPVTLALGESLEQWFEAFRIAQGAEIWQTLGGWIRDTNPEIGDGIRQRLDWCATISAEDAAKAQAHRDAITDRVNSITRDGAVLVLPVAPGPALVAGQAAVASNDIRAAIIRLSGIAPLTRTPQLSLPVARVGTYPVALSLLGAAGSDETLLAMATALCGPAENGIAAFR